MSAASSPTLEQDARILHQRLKSSFLEAEAAISAASKGAPAGVIAGYLSTVVENYSELVELHDCLAYFRQQRQRIAAASGDSPIVISPLSHHCPSYHDAVEAFVDHFALEILEPIYDNQPDSWAKILLGFRIPDDLGSVVFQSRCLLWRDRFEDVLSEYQAHLDAEASELLSGSEFGDDIPKEYRTKPMTKQELAKHHSGENPSNASQYLKRLNVRVLGKPNSKLWIADLRDFPETKWDELRS